MRRLATILLVALALSACGDVVSESERLLFTDDDDGAVAVLSVGETFSVELPGYPSAGLRWFIVPTDSNLCRLVESEFEHREDAAEWDGVHRFTLEALREGIEVVEFEYATGSPGGTVAGTYALTLDIRS